MNHQLVNKDNFGRSVFHLVVPMALQNLINVAVTSADVIMLVRVGETSLSGVSQAGQVQFIMTLIFFGLTSGAAVLTAQYWGKEDTRTIEKVMGIALRFSLIIGLLFTLLALLFPAPIMSIFTPDPQVIAEGAKYLRIVSVTYLMSSITLIYLNIMRSVERVVISTAVYAASLFINIGVNAVLIFGLLGFPAMGAAGAAVGTTVARGVELIIALSYARWIRRNTAIEKKVTLNWRDIFVRDKQLFRDFLRYSLPVTANELMWGLGTSMNAVIIGHVGTAMVSANAVAQVTRQLATVVSFGIANAAAIMIGKSIGEQNNEKALDQSRRFVRLTLISGLCGSAIILALRPVLLKMVSLPEEATAILSMMLFVMAYFVLAQAYNTTQVVGIFRAGGDTRFGLILDVSTMWGGSILMGALAAFVFHWNVTAIYMLLLCDELIKIPLTTWRYKTKKWLRNVTR